MKKIVFLVLSISFLFISCNNEIKNGAGFRKANGNLYYGGIFKINESEKFNSFYPLKVVEVTSIRIVNQIYEGLVKLDQRTVKIVPSLAEKWTNNDDATLWTFQLRKNVYFQDDACFPGGKGRLVTAKDVKYCFDRLCAATPNSSNFDFTFKDRVIGANEYYESSKHKRFLPGGVEGVKVIDDYTLQISLVYPIATFTNIISQVGCLIYPKEMIEHYGDSPDEHPVGTGPFRLLHTIKDSLIVLERNDKYWAHDEFGNQLPYLDGIKISFINDKQEELLQFRKGNLDMVFQLPSNVIGSILSEFKNAKLANRPFQLQVTPSMSVFMFGFNLQHEIFKNVNVRKAFSLAIDREKMSNHILKGDAIPACGFIPRTKVFENMGYDFSNLKVCEYNPEKAKKLLAQAGYPKGKGFPKIVLESNPSSRNTLIAKSAQEMFKQNLNVDVEILELPFAQVQEDIANGKCAMWKLKWIADYPEGETFLSLFYGKFVPSDPNEASHINVSRYKSESFDSLYASAIREPNLKKRAALYMQANKEITDKAVVIPVFCDESYRMLQSNVRNFDINPLEYRDFTYVNMVPRREEKPAVSDK